MNSLLCTVLFILSLQTLPACSMDGKYQNVLIELFAYTGSLDDKVTSALMQTNKSINACLQGIHNTYIQRHKVGAHEDQQEAVHPFGRSYIKATVSRDKYLLQTTISRLFPETCMKSVRVEKMALVLDTPITSLLDVFFIPEKIIIRYRRCDQEHMKYHIHEIMIDECNNHVSHELFYKIKNRVFPNCEMILFPSIGYNSADRSHFPLLEQHTKYAQRYFLNEAHTLNHTIINGTSICIPIVDNPKDTIAIIDCDTALTIDESYKQELYNFVTPSQVKKKPESGFVSAVCNRFTIFTVARKIDRKKFFKRVRLLYKVHSCDEAERLLRNYFFDSYYVGERVLCVQNFDAIFDNELNDPAAGEGVKNLLYTSGALIGENCCNITGLEKVKKHLDTQRVVLAEDNFHISLYPYGYVDAMSNPCRISSWHCDAQGKYPKLNVSVPRKDEELLAASAINSSGTAVACLFNDYAYNPTKIFAQRLVIVSTRVSAPSVVKIVPLASAQESDGHLVDEDIVHGVRFISGSYVGLVKRCGWFRRLTQVGDHISIFNQYERCPLTNTTIKYY